MVKHVLKADLDANDWLVFGIKCLPFGKYLKKTLQRPSPVIEQMSLPESVPQDEIGT